MMVVVNVFRFLMALMAGVTILTLSVFLMVVSLTVDVLEMIAMFVDLIGRMLSAIIEDQINFMNKMADSIDGGEEIVEVDEINQENI